MKRKCTFHTHALTNIDEAFFSVITFLSLITAQSQVIDSSIYLMIGNTKVLCSKDTFILKDTQKATPIFMGYHIIDSTNYKYIKTEMHFEYNLTDFRGVEYVYNKIQVDSVWAQKFLGEEEKDSLFNIITRPITFNDLGTVYKINNNFNIELIQKDSYVQLSRGELYWKTILKYEISQLSSGDFIILKDLNFDTPLENNNLTAIYWRIK